MKIVKCKKPYKLQNQGNLELMFIGCGTAFSKNLFNNNFIIVKGKTHLLVDFGMTGPMALKKNAGLEVYDIENVLVTHSHADHIGGIEQLALFNRYVAQRMLNKSKIQMIISEEYEKILWEMSLRGGMEWNETSSASKKLNFKDYFIPVRPKLIQTVPRLTLEIDFEGIHLEIFGTNHIPDNAETQNEAFITYGIYVDNSIFISCDTKFDRSLIDLYSNRSEYMFHDVSFTPNPVHASLDQLETLPDDIKQKMLLMHYADEWGQYDVSNFKGLVHEGSRYIF